MGPQYQLGESIRSRAWIELQHPDLVARGLVHDLGHVALDQKQPAATCPFEILIGSWVGNAVGVKAPAFIGNTEYDAVMANAVPDGDGFGGIVAITVLDRVGQGFLE
jgi:hypothetical protein